jgi:hypothetical protein
LQIKLRDLKLRDKRPIACAVGNGRGVPKLAGPSPEVSINDFPNCVVLQRGLAYHVVVQGVGTNVGLHGFFDAGQVSKCVASLTRSRATTNS